MINAEELDRRVRLLTNGFDRFLAVGAQNWDDSGSHAATISRRLKLGSAVAAIEDDEFLQSLWKTLPEWLIGRRGSKLVPFEEFCRILQSASPLLADLENVTIDDPASDVGDVGGRLWQLFEAVEGLTTNYAKTVAVTKTLHHVLPDLVVPIDGAFTGVFFGRSGLPDRSKSFFLQSFETFTRVGRAVDLESYVGVSATSRTKAIDNAIIGFVTVELEARVPPSGEIAEIQAALRSFADQRDWDQFHTAKNLAMALAAESGELLEIFQWLTPEESTLAQDSESQRAASEEIADVIIYALRLADVLGIDVTDAVQSKIRLNAERYPVEKAKGNAIKYSRRQP